MHPHVYTVLSAAQRRRLLEDLRDNCPQSIDPRFEDETPTPAEIRFETVRMHHVHLPMLADYGFIEWTPGDEKVTRGPEFDRIEEVLQAATA